MRGQTLVVGARHLTFKSVPADIAAYCMRLGQPMSARRGDVLARQGDRARRCYLVRSGYAKVASTSPAGHQVLVGFLGPLDLIGPAAAGPSTESYMATTVAIQPMELVSWSRESALELADRFPAVHARLDALIARHLQTMLNRLHTVSEGRVTQRLASALLELAARHGDPDECGSIAIRPLVTREDLAALTGITVYTASRVLADWEANGLLASRRGRVRVTNLARLRALAHPTT